MTILTRIIISKTPVNRTQRLPYSRQHRQHAQLPRTTFAYRYPVREKPTDFLGLEFCHNCVMKAPALALPIRFTFCSTLPALFPSSSIRKTRGRCRDTESKITSMTTNNWPSLLCVALDTSMSTLVEVFLISFENRRLFSVVCTIRSPVKFLKFSSLVFANFPSNHASSLKSLRTGAIQVSWVVNIPTIGTRYLELTWWKHVRSSRGRSSIDFFQSQYKRKGRSGVKRAADTYLVIQK